jgi:hypothetical protein
MKKVLVAALLIFAAFDLGPSRVEAQTLKAGITSKTLFYLPFWT